MALIVKRAKGKAAARGRRHLRVRKQVTGTAARPRLVVSRSSRHVFVQVVDDTAGKTLASASTMESDVRTLEGDKTASVLAFRVQGADSAELVDVFKETADAEADPLVWHPETISGKDVEIADPNEDFPTPIALYPTGEVMYFVSSSDQAVLEAVLAKLP